MFKISNASLFWENVLGLNINGIMNIMAMIIENRILFFIGKYPD